VLFHENPRKGRSTLESRIPFQRAIDLEPANLNARIHLARLDALEGKLESLGAHAEVFRNEGALSERAVEVDAIIADATGDAEELQRVMDTIQSSPWYFTFYAVHGVIRYARDPSEAAKLLEHRPSNDPLLTWFIPQIDVMRGQLAAYNSFMRSGPFQRTPTWDLHEAFMATSGVVPTDRARLEVLLQRLEAADLQETRDTGLIEAHDDITLDFLAFENAYHRAVILAQIGRLREADALLAEMRSSDAFPGLGSIREDVIIAVEAELAVARGDAQEALDVLRQSRYEIPHAASVRPIADGTRSRYLRAELEYTIGDRDVALNFYKGLDESWSPFDSFYRGPVYLRLAQIAEEDGRLDDAILNYSRLVEMWREADPVLKDTYQSVHDRLDALIQRRQSEPADVPSAS
jgi:tetratricopeptide (TPR) repeat protein